MENNLIKVSDLKEYALLDTIENAADAYLTIDGVQYVKINCLKTYMAKENVWQNGWTN